MTVSIGFLLVILGVGFVLGLLSPFLLMLYFVMRADVNHSIAGHELGESAS